MVKLEKIKPGDRLLDIHREKIGNTTMSQWGLWYVLVVEVDLPRNRALVRWNEVNQPQWWSRRKVEKLYTKETKAYREQREWTEENEMTTQETIALAATIWDEAKSLSREHVKPWSQERDSIDTHAARCQQLYLKLCEEGTPGYALHDVRVASAALKVIDALGETDVDQIRIPGVLALALLNLERVVRRASSEELKQSLKHVERHPSHNLQANLYRHWVAGEPRPNALDATHTYPESPAPQALQILDKLCGEPALASPEALAGLRELVYVATKEQGFADTLAKKCDELAAENKRLESENNTLKGELVHMRAVR